MGNVIRQLCGRLLRLPREPEPPPGDEAQTRRFHAASNFYKYLLALWVLKTGGLVLVTIISMAPIVGAFIALTHRGKPLAFLLLLIPGAIFGVLLLFRLVSLAIVHVDFEQRWYLVTDRSLRVREGILLVREATVTFANIQNISISQGPLQRALGIADLRVDTAGGGASSGHGKQPAMYNLHTTWFRGVDNANEIRELMQQRLRQLKDSGLGDHEEMTAHAPSPAAASPDVLAALREVAAEARALRETAEKGE